MTDYQGKRILYHAIIAATLIIITLVVACTSTSNQQATPIPSGGAPASSVKTTVTGIETAQPIQPKGPDAPKYTPGDIVSSSFSNNGWLILDYNSETDCYTKNEVSLSKGKWVYIVWDPGTFNRELEERDDPIVIGHTDPQSVTTPAPPTPTPGPKYKSGDIVGRARGESTGLFIYGTMLDERAYITAAVRYRNGEWVYDYYDCTPYDREDIEGKYPVVLSSKIATQHYCGSGPW
jgi:tetrahydromethanopterin S-methyltransferase subunit D